MLSFQKFGFTNSEQYQVFESIVINLNIERCIVFNNFLLIHLWLNVSIELQAVVIKYVSKEAEHVCSHFSIWKYEHLSKGIIQKRLLIKQDHRFSLFRNHHKEYSLSFSFVEGSPKLWFEIWISLFANKVYESYRILQPFIFRLKCLPLNSMLAFICFQYWLCRTFIVSIIHSSFVFLCSKDPKFRELER